MWPAIVSAANGRGKPPGAAGRPQALAARREALSGDEAR
jgi:hypothetical protein